MGGYRLWCATWGGRVDKLCSVWGGSSFALEYLKATRKIIKKIGGDCLDTNRKNSSCPPKFYSLKPHDLLPQNSNQDGKTIPIFTPFPPGSLARVCIAVCVHVPGSREKSSMTSIDIGNIHSSNSYACVAEFAKEI